MPKNRKVCGMLRPKKLKIIQNNEFPNDVTCSLTHPEGDDDWFFNKEGIVHILILCKHTLLEEHFGFLCNVQ